MDKKEMYWKYFIDPKNKKWWGHGVTVKKLEKVKDKVFLNKDIWWDLLDRHKGKDWNSVEEFLEDDKKNNYHGWSNFTTSVYYYAIGVAK